MPEQHSPPVYAFAAGAVLHAHADSTLEPAVVLHTFLPVAVRDRLDGADVRVDVSSDGPGSGTVTVRVLADGQALTWSLPLAPLVAALPGQSGDDGRMVLLAVVDAEPAPGFWAQAVDCEQLAAELQLPVADLAEALRGRLTPWLAEDLELLLHDDAHDRAADSSPAQIVADAVLAHYRGDLDAADVSGRLVQALVYAPEPSQLEIGARLCAALAAAVRVAGPAVVATVLGGLGPFEAEEQRLLSALPEAMALPQASETEAAMDLVIASPDRDEGVRAAVRVTAQLARAAFGPDLPPDQVLARLEMVDDAGLLRLARLWVDLALGAAGDARHAEGLPDRVRAQGRPGVLWLRGTATALASAAVGVAGRRVERILPSLRDAQEAADSEVEARVRAGLDLAKFVRTRAGIGPGSWLLLPAPAAASAALGALLDGADTDNVVDLLAELLENDVDSPDLLDGLVCATASLLVGLDPQQDDAVRRMQVADLLSAVQGGPRGPRWLLGTLLRLAPGHDPLAVDLAAFLPDERAVDPDRAVEKLGLHGLLRAGLDCLAALAAVLGEEADLPLEELYRDVLPGALEEHQLLRSS
jgi:hypothetical protein